MFIYVIDSLLSMIHQRVVLVRVQFHDIVLAVQVVQTHDVVVEQLPVRVYLNFYLLS